MKILVIGLGSMGTRRIRNLKALGVEDIYGFDRKAARRERAESTYGIKTFQSFDACKDLGFDGYVISVPPDQHMFYMEYAVEHGIKCFVEASVVDDGMEALIRKEQRGAVRVCPSCTMRFHPSIKLIKKLMDQDAIGKVSNFSYHSGQYLPDWHPWEDINDFYVSNPPTGGGREIVPFEMTWMNWAFGDVACIKGFYDKTIGLNAPIDDTYVATIRYKSGVIGTLIVDVVSRKAVRKLIINGEQGQLYWDWDKKQVEHYDARERRSIVYGEPEGHAQSGYNANLIEEMYIEEMSHFLSYVQENTPFPNTLAADHRILKDLYALEASDSDRK